MRRFILNASHERRQIVACGCDEHLEVDRPVTVHDAVAQPIRVRPRNRRMIDLETRGDLADHLAQHCEVPQERIRG